MKMTMLFELVIVCGICMRIYCFLPLISIVSVKPDWEGVINSGLRFVRHLHTAKVKYSGQLKKFAVIKVDYALIIITFHYRAFVIITHILSLIL